MTEKTDIINSYGAIVFRENEAGNLQVLMIQVRPGWSFPKGHMEKGETPEKTAIRETKEETGIDISVDSRFCVMVDSARKDDKRKVFFFLGECLQENPEPSPSEEVMDAKWVDWKEALPRIWYPPDGEALCSAQKYWNTLK